MNLPAPVPLIPGAHAGSEGVFLSAQSLCAYALTFLDGEAASRAATMNQENRLKLITKSIGNEFPNRFVVLRDAETFDY